VWKAALYVCRRSFSEMAMDGRRSRSYDVIWEIEVSHGEHEIQAESRAESAVYSRIPARQRKVTFLRSFKNQEMMAEWDNS
jgi:hypothetical protein